MGSYRQGKRTGPWTFRYASGNPRAKGSYTDDRERGPWVIYQADSPTATTMELNLTDDNYYDSKHWLRDIEPAESDEDDDDPFGFDEEEE